MLTTRGPFALTHIFYKDFRNEFHDKSSNAASETMHGLDHLFQIAVTPTLLI